MSKSDTKDTKDDFQPKSAKQKIIRINPMALVSMFMTGNEIGVKKGIDAGTRYVGGGYDAMTNTFFVHVEHDQFEDIPIGDRLPPVDIELVDLRQKNIDGSENTDKEK